MSAWGAIGPGTRVLILAIGGVVLAGAGALVWRVTQTAEPEPSVAVAPASAVAPEAAVEVTAAQEAAPVPAAAPVLPKLDTWRVAPDGEALVAGMALPGARVEVVVDDRPVAEGMALASGEFVLQFTLQPNPDPSLLWLSMTPPDGTPVASVEIVALAPIAGPRLAVAEPEPALDIVPEAAPAGIAEVGPETVPEPGTAAETAPSALLVSEEGAVVLQESVAPDPALAGQVMIDTITYAPTGAVQIGGRGDAGSALRLYLDNAEVATATVAGDGRWLVGLGDSKPGIYTLRVDQIDAAGKVTSRFETPFKRETLEALALASGTAQAIENEAAKAVAPDAPVPEAAPEPAPPVAAEDAPDPAPEVAAASAPVAPPPAEIVAETVAEAVAEPVALAETAPTPAVTITVQPGFTLWGIAQERLGDGVLYVQVFEANRDKIGDPDLIYPGQVFSIPGGLAP